MSFKLSSLLIFFALWDVSRTIQIHSTRMLDTSYVTKSGNISINSDNDGYFLNVDVSDHYSDASDDENYDNDKTMTYMTMALYTSQTILINGTCLDFKTYNCSEFGCTPYTSNSSTPVLPYFQVTEGYYAKADVILDYNYWKLNTNATIAISCTIPHISYGNGRVGMLGLGQSSGSQANFLVDGSVFFSVYLDPSNRKSSLLFKSNTNITSISEKVGGLATNADWNVLPQSVSISVLNYTTTAVLGAIFDINVQEIGFPVSIYKEIMQALQSTGLLNCEEDVIYDPTCYFDYAPNNDAFPTIKLTFDTGDIELPPDLYMAITIPIRVYLKALDPSLSGVNYVTEQYKNYIVFGSSFLTYYYSEYYYNGETYFVDLYKPNFSNPATGSSDWPYIVGAALGFIIFVGVIVFLVKRRRNKRIRDQAQKKLDFNESSQALISSAKAPESVSIPSYQRDYTKYEYGQESWISPDVPQSS